MIRRPPPPAGPWLVAGLGRAGIAAAKALESFAGPASVRAWDQAVTPLTRATAQQLGRRGISVTLGGDGLGALDAGVRSVVKAPGIAFDIPVLAAAAQRGRTIIDEFELGWRLASDPIIAVTGTNGKSTTCALIIEALAAAGDRPPLAGNTEFGVPLSAVATNRSPIVAEVRDRGGATVTYGRANDADYRIADVRWTMDQGQMTLRAPDGQIALTTRHPGAHNASNVAAAFATAEAFGVPRAQTSAALERAPRVRGRLEAVDEGQPFHALVDFAHTYDGVAQTLATVRAVIHGRVIAVLSVMGTGLDPLKWEIGRVGRAQSDVLIITTATVRGEPRMPTVQRLYEGAKQVSGGPIAVEPDRRGAIARALELARPGDAVVVLGRGAHGRIVIDRSGGWVPFVDRQVMRELLRATS